MKKEFQNIIYKNIKLDGLTNDCLDQILEPAIREAVLKTKTPLDDMAFAKFYPELEELIKEKVKEFYAKLLGQE